MFLGGMQPLLPVRPILNAGLAIPQAGIPFGGLFQYGMGGFAHRSAGGVWRHHGDDAQNGCS